MNMILVLAWGFMRRFWGGWETEGFSHWAKLGVAFGLGLLTGVFSFQSIYPALAFSIMAPLAFLNPFHAKGQNMGYRPGNPDMLDSVIYMSGSYGVITSMISAIMLMITGNPSYIFYAPVGLLASIGYLIAWPIYERYFKISDGVYKSFWRTGTTEARQPVYFLDGPTSVGEIFLGLVIGSILL